MADHDPTDELFALWRRQVEAGTAAWSKAVEQMGGAPRPAAGVDPTMFWRPLMDQMAMWSHMQGASAPNPDVLALWKKFVDDWIAAWSKALERAMGTEAFAQALGQTLDQVLNAQGAARQAAEKSGKVTLQALGLPSREQVAGVSRQLMDLEERVESLEDAVAAAAAAPAGATRSTTRTAAKQTRPAAKKARARKKRVP